jgi:hypothetical protein
MMLKKNVPARLWDYGISCICETGNVITNSSRYADQRTPLKIITGETPDITKYLNFAIYDWVTFKTNAGVAPPELGRWLGVSHRVGQLISYWILPGSGIPISCTTVQRLTNLEIQTDKWKARMLTFEKNLESKFEATSSDVMASTKDIPGDKLLDLEREDRRFIEEFTRVIDNESIKHADEDVYDMEVGGIDP